MNLQRRRTDTSTYNFTTTTGRGPAPVVVGYEVDSDGDVYDVVVHQLDNGAEISASLDDDSFDVLTDECYAHYERYCADHTDDMAIERSLSAAEYRECI